MKVLLSGANLICSHLKITLNSVDLKLTFPDVGLLLCWLLNYNSLGRNNFYHFSRTHDLVAEVIIASVTASATVEDNLSIVSVIAWTCSPSPWLWSCLDSWPCSPSCECPWECPCPWLWEWACDAETWFHSPLVNIFSTIQCCLSLDKIRFVISARYWWKFENKIRPIEQGRIWIESSFNIGHR